MERIAEPSWSRAVFLCSSVSSNRPREEKWRREELVGGHSHLPGVVFLPFIWTGIGIQFQLSVLHLLKHTETHTHARTQTHTTRSGGKSKGCLNSTETLQRLSESSCVEQWPQGRDYTLITTHTHTDAHKDMHTHMHTHAQTQYMYTVQSSKYTRTQTHTNVHVHTYFHRCGTVA